MPLIEPMTPAFASYLSDESRTHGAARNISPFPAARRKSPRYCAGAPSMAYPSPPRAACTGLAGGASPQGGLALNLSRMDRILGPAPGQRGHLAVAGAAGGTAAAGAQGAEGKELPNLPAGTRPPWPPCGISAPGRPFSPPTPRKPPPASAAWLPATPAARAPTCTGPRAPRSTPCGWCSPTAASPPWSGAYTGPGAGKPCCP